MIMRDRSSTSYDLATLFRARLSSSDSWIGKIAKRIGTRASALHSYLHFEECSQNCFLFDVVNLENGGNLAEQVHFKLADRQIERQRQG
jgi:Ni2+-binding GTPase involved in maturation of urease and hydrogenase